MSRGFAPGLVPEADREKVGGVKFSAVALTCLLALPTLAGEADGWRKLPPATADWKDAVRICGAGREVRALDRPADCRLQGALAAKSSAGFPAEKAAGLSIAFPDSAAARDFSRFVRKDGSQAKSVWKSGSATLTRTVLIDRASGAVVIHLLADHPGALTFRTSLETGAARMEDRRQLFATAKDGMASHVWVLPFESDVEPDKGAILVRGEGEAMVIWAFGKAGAEKELAGTFARLAARYDPGREHPDFSKIWRGVLADHGRAADSP